MVAIQAAVWLLKLRAKIGGKSFERVLICYGPPGSKSASSGFFIFLALQDGPQVGTSSAKVKIQFIVNHRHLFWARVKSNQFYSELS